MELKPYNNFDDSFRASMVTFLDKELQNKPVTRKIEKSIYNSTIKSERTTRRSHYTIMCI